VAQRFGRSLIRHGNRSQGGDQSYGNVSGGDQTTVNGMDPAEALAFIREYIWERDQAQEREMQRLADALELHEIAEAQRRKADDQARARRQRTMDLWLLILTAMLLLELVAVGWLIADRRAWEATMPLLRYWLGAALAAAASWRLP
jgi:hypothetical protein